MLLELDHPNVIKYYDFFLHQERGGVGMLLPRNFPVVHAARSAADVSRGGCCGRVTMGWC